MNKRTRAKKNLIIAIAMIIIGVTIIYVSNMMYVFRLDGGYGAMPDSYMTGLFSIFICLAEMTVGMAGIGFIAIGAVSAYNNSKKMR